VYAGNGPVTRVDPSGNKTILANLKTIITNWGGRWFSFNVQFSQNAMTQFTFVRVELDIQDWDLFGLITTWKWTGVRAFAWGMAMQTLKMRANSGMFRGQCGKWYRYWYDIKVPWNVVVLPRPFGQHGARFKLC
jgi:hypothetical protein